MTKCLGPHALMIVVFLIGGSEPAMAAEKEAAPAGTSADTARTQGVRVAIETVAASMGHIETHLAELLATVPESSRQGIRRAIAASRQGREMAVASLAGAAPRMSTVAATKGSDAWTRGRIRARVAITAGTARTEQALRETLEEADEAVRSSLRVAIGEVRRGANEALTALDALVPERAQNSEVAAASPGATTAGAAEGVEVSGR